MGDLQFVDQEVTMQLLDDAFQEVAEWTGVTQTYTSKLWFFGVPDGEYYLRGRIEEFTWWYWKDETSGTTDPDLAVLITSPGEGYHLGLNH